MPSRPPDSPAEQTARVDQALRVLGIEIHVLGGAPYGALATLAREQSVSRETARQWYRGIKAIPSGRTLPGEGPDLAAANDEPAINEDDITIPPEAP